MYEVIVCLTHKNKVNPFIHLKKDMLSHNFDIKVLNHNGTLNDTINFGTSKINSKFQINYNIIGAWDYFPVWANNQSYDYFWVIENDVKFTGNWKILFDKYEHLNCDLLACHIGHRGDNWHWLRSHNTLSKTYVAAYLPFSRFSSRLVKEGYKTLSAGNKAYLEIFWSTLCNMRGFTMTNMENSDFGFFTWLPKGQSTTVNSKEINKLWHPVKP